MVLVEMVLVEMVLVQEAQVQGLVVSVPVQAEQVQGLVVSVLVQEAQVQGLVVSAPVQAEQAQVAEGTGPGMGRGEPGRRGFHPPHGVPGLWVVAKWEAGVKYPPEVPAAMEPRL